MPTTKPPSKPHSPQQLSARQLAFLFEYTKDWNAGAAAVRAGYAAHSARNTAYKLLRQPAIMEKIGALKHTMEKKVELRMELSSEQTLRKMADVAYFDPRKFVREDGSTKNLTELDEQSAMAVAGFKTTEQWIGEGPDKRREVLTEYRLVNRTAGLDMAAKVLGDYKADNEQRRNARDMTDEEIRARMLTLLGGGTPANEPPDTLQ